MSASRPVHSVLIAKLLLLCSSDGSYSLQRSGQDVKVYKDEKLVFFSGVPDTSEGSDTDQTISGSEEFFNGCMWTYRQKVEMCEGQSCGEAELMAHDMQQRLRNFYADRTKPPPLEDVSWLILGSLPEQRREIFESCPGLIVTSLLFMAEVFTFSSARDADAYAREAEGLTASLQQASPTQAESMFSMFPVQEAYSNFMVSRSSLEEARPPPSLDIVIARCKSPLQWLWEFTLPPRTRVVVYEKCGMSPDNLREQVKGLDSTVNVVQVSLPDNEDQLMTGECTAFLSHVLRFLGTNDVADYTVFLQDDAPRHIRLALLALVFRSMLVGMYEVPFLHLVHERYPSFHTPCLSNLYREVFGTELKGLLGTYCCAHFVVSRDRIVARPMSFYNHVLKIVSDSDYAKTRGGNCEVGRKPCYVIEFLWHHIFGEDIELPRRVDHASLPLALRFEGGRSSQRPSPLKVAPYLATFQPARYSNYLASL